MQTQERLTRTQDRQNHTTRVSYLVKAMRSILAGQRQGRAKRTRLFVFHVLKRVYSTSTLYLLLADEPGGTERKGMRGGRSFPSFPVIVFPDRSREVTHVRKGSLGIQNPEAAGNGEHDMRMDGQDQRTRLLHAPPLLTQALPCPNGLRSRNTSSKTKQRILRW